MSVERELDKMLSVSKWNAVKSVLLGLAGFLGAFFSVSVNYPPLAVTILWSYFLPLLAGMAYGAKYGLIAGVLGLGAFFPFVLWPTNGWANWVTVILYILLYAWFGYFASVRQSRPAIWNHPLVIGLPYILFYFTATLLLYPLALSFNPPFWEPSAISSVPTTVLTAAFTKGILLMYLIVICNVGLLKIPVIRRLLGLSVPMKSQLNGRIFAAAMLGSFGLWYILLVFNRIFIDHTFPQGLLQITDPHEITGLIIFVTAGFFIGYFISLTMESRLAINQYLDLMNEKLEMRVEERTCELTAAHQELTAQLEELKQMQVAQERNVDIQYVLKKIAEAALLEPSLDKLYVAVHGLIGRVLPVEHFHINFLDVASGKLVVQYCAGEMKGIPRERAVGKGIMEYAMRKGKALHIDSVEFDRLFEKGEITLKMMPVNDWLVAPLINSQGGVFGTIALNSMEKTQPFLAEDAEALSIIAAQVSMAIERKRNEEELRESEARFRALTKQSSEAIIVYDLNGGRIVEVNEASTRMFGYSEEELLSMKTRDIAVLSDNEIRRLVDELRTHGNFPLAVGRYHHKKGYVVFAERMGSLINHKQQELALVTHRDITAERKLQETIRNEVQLAGIIQRAMVPPDYSDEKVTIRTIYEPVHLVSGDFFGYKWSDDGTVLNGYMLDVTGHGMATALQTSAISSMLNGLLNDKLFGSVQLLTEVNSKLACYLPEGAFAAVITFKLDLRQEELTCVSGGINHFWASVGGNYGLFTLPGSYMGVSDDPEFETIIIPVQSGDAFYFLTDGLIDQIIAGNLPTSQEFPETVRNLEEMAGNPEKLDDCSALCVIITK